ncbi:F0F1 ATP synthase subunit delta [Candidatus Mycoplasma haematolamae str. Purdue]|uniref:ATP synthase subunit delta n=1 Tax=Mycoplasma haematolamae (strain Purdue) TaxID=1212765 RepID=I7CF30_MYCHA|nr:F0F1 ATP synthase subunit delta [Candidatus Mycoplasma haematolamae]AFO51866.1 F0F1 ATP synthase subunit delta [Candidatus Mycoplasma haematolamae str. Purdue]
MSLKTGNSREKITRFATALVDCYSEREDFLRLFEESESLALFLQKFPEFESFLNAPLESYSKKEKFLKELLRMFAFHQRYLPSTILLLLKYELIGSLSLFLKQLMSRLEWVLSYKYIKVWSAEELSEENKKRLIESLEVKFGSRIKVEYKLSKEMIVGLKLEYDDYQIECSLAKKLQDIRLKLLGQQVHG